MWTRTNGEKSVNFADVPIMNGMKSMVPYKVARWQNFAAQRSGAIVL